MEVTPGNIIDQLITVNTKIFFLENVKRDADATDSQIAEATKKTNTLNVQRHILIQELDKFFGKDTQQGSLKMYGKE